MENILKENDLVSITRGGKEGYKDKGKVIYSLPMEMLIEITDSQNRDIIGRRFQFGLIKNIWHYINNGNYSERDSGYSIDNLVENN